MKGALLETLAWPEAAQWFESGAPVVLPVGAAAKEHGLHLPLDTDARTARALGRALAETLPVLIAPVLNVGHYPVFVDYPGSQSLKAETFEAVVAELIGGFVHQGCRRIAVLNTGVSIEAACAGPGAGAGIEIEILHLRELGRAEEHRLEQQGGGHADEQETSMMLAIAPDTVRMDRAEPATGAGTPGAERPKPMRFSPDPDAGAAYNPTCATGDPSLATPEKGRALLAATLADITARLTARWPDLAG